MLSSKTSSSAETRRSKYECVKVDSLIYSMYHAKAEFEFIFKIIPAAFAAVIVWTLLVRLMNENWHCFEDSWKEKLSSALSLIL